MSSQGAAVILAHFLIFFSKIDKPKENKNVRPKRKASSFSEKTLKYGY